MISRIYPILNLKPNELVNKEFLKKVLTLSPDFLQLRIKEGTDNDFLKNIEIIKGEIEKSNSKTQLIINDDLKIAIQTKTNFVHLGQEDFLEVKNSIKNNVKIGLSTHTFKQVEEANNLDLEYIGFGPVFETKTKNTGYNSVFKMTEEVLKISKHKVVFIGGIKKDNFFRLPLGGKTYFAVISGIKNFI